MKNSDYQENPFYISDMIPDEYFCDRETETRELTSLLKNGNNVVLFSPRRMGKSGLIHHTFSRSDFASDYVFYVDLLSTGSMQELSYALDKEVFEVLSRKKPVIINKFLNFVKSLKGELGYDPLSGLPKFTLALGDIKKPSETFDEILSFLESLDRHCYVAFDEFQQIAEYSEKNVEAILRTKIQTLNNVNFMFSGSERETLALMFHSYDHPFFSSATDLNLQAIPEDTYVAFAVKMFKNNGKEIDEEAVRAVYSLFKGNTFYMQRTMNECFAITKQGGHCSEENVRYALERILRSNEQSFKTGLSFLTPKQRELLKAIADEGDVKDILSQAFIARHSLGGGASSVQAVSNALLKKKVISKSQGTYYLNDRFLELWLRMR